MAVWLGVEVRVNVFVGVRLGVLVRVAVLVLDGVIVFVNVSDPVTDGEDVVKVAVTSEDGDGVAVDNDVFVNVIVEVCV